MSNLAIYMILSFFWGGFVSTGLDQELFSIPWIVTIIAPHIFFVLGAYSK